MATEQKVITYTTEEIIDRLGKCTEATQSSDGLLSAEDKATLDTLAGQDDLHTRNTGIYYDGGLPTIYGQPLILFASGTPADGNTPYNWKSYDKDTGGGYEWTGEPSGLGQRYIDVTGGAEYVAVRTSWDISSANYNLLKWMQL